MQVAGPSNAPLRVATFSWVCDATNSAIWQRRKLHNLILKASYHFNDGDIPFDAAMKPSDLTDHVTSVHALADLLPVETGTGMEALAMVRKQLASIGCPLVGALSV